MRAVSVSCRRRVRLVAVGKHAKKTKSKSTHERAARVQRSSLTKRALRSPSHRGRCGRASATACQCFVARKPIACRHVASAGAPRGSARPRLRRLFIRPGIAARLSITTRWRARNFWPGDGAAHRLTAAHRRPDARAAIHSAADAASSASGERRLSLAGYAEADEPRGDLRARSWKPSTLARPHRPGDLIRRALLHALLARHLPRAARETAQSSSTSPRAHDDGDVALFPTRHRRRAEQLETRRAMPAATSSWRARSRRCGSTSATADEVVLADGSALPLRERHPRDAAGRGGALAALGVRGARNGGALPKPRAGERRVARFHHDIFRP